MIIGCFALLPNDVWEGMFIGLSFGSKCLHNIVNYTIKLFQYSKVYSKKFKITTWVERKSQILSKILKKKQDQCSSMVFVVTEYE